MKNSLQRIARQGVARGLTIGEAFRRESEFPLVVINLMAVSEKAGHLEEILLTLSTFYESEIDSSVKTLVSIIEPAMLVVIGGIVGIIAMSVIVPIYQLVGQF
jgi:type IV pilus assembly protein PilC